MAPSETPQEHIRNALAILEALRESSFIRGGVVLDAAELAAVRRRLEQAVEQLELTERQSRPPTRF